MSDVPCSQEGLPPRFAESAPGPGERCSEGASHRAVPGAGPRLQRALRPGPARRLRRDGLRRRRRPGGAGARLGRLLAAALQTAHTAGHREAREGVCR